MLRVEPTQRTTRATVGPAARVVERKPESYWQTPNCTAFVKLVVNESSGSRLQNCAATN